MNLPNALTISRLALALVLMALLGAAFPLAKSLALVVFLVAGITDYLDGHLARRSDQVTSFGQLMDPLTDKVLVCAAFVALVEQDVVPGWIAVVVLAREFLVTGLRLLGADKGRIIPAGRWGKHKTAWQMGALTALLLGLAVRDDLLPRLGPAWAPSYYGNFQFLALCISLAVGMVTVASGLGYFLEHRDLIRMHLR